MGFTYLGLRYMTDLIYELVKIHTHFWHRKKSHIYIFFITFKVWVKSWHFYTVNDSSRRYFLKSYMYRCNILICKSYYYCLILIRQSIHLAVLCAGNWYMIVFPSSISQISYLRPEAKEGKLHSVTSYRVSLAHCLRIDYILCH